MLALLRAQRTKIAPQLSLMTEGPDLDIAKKNSKRMLDEEIRIIIGPGVDPQKEMAILSSIGFDNKSLMLAYFQNSNLNAGSDANIDIIKGNPLADWRFTRDGVLQVRIWRDEAGQLCYYGPPRWHENVDRPINLIKGPNVPPTVEEIAAELKLTDATPADFVAPSERRPACGGANTESDP